MNKVTFKQQLKNNLLAIISIFIAVSSLSYNTWRNEQTEFNRNVRTSSFQILMSLAELQLLVDYAFYSDKEAKNDPIKGWSYVLYIQDLSKTVSPEIVTSADNLHNVWRDNWHEMIDDEQSTMHITEAIKSNRSAVLSTLQNLK